MTNSLLTRPEHPAVMPHDVHRPGESIRAAVERALRRASFVGLRDVTASVPVGCVAWEKQGGRRT